MGQGGLEGVGGSPGSVICECHMLEGGWDCTVAFMFYIYHYWPI